MSAAQARRHSLAHAENLLWIFFRFKRILAHITMSFEEGFEFIGAHALRANVGRCDLYILRHELGNHAHEIGRVCPGVTGYVAKNKSLTCRAHATWCH